MGDIHPSRYCKIAKVPDERGGRMFLIGGLMRKSCVNSNEAAFFI